MSEIADNEFEVFANGELIKTVTTPDGQPRITQIRVIGGRGNDDLSVDVLPDGPPSAQLFGGEGDDRLRGSFGNDSLVGGVGNDRVVGRDGDDTIGGGVGDDVVLGGRGDDSLVGFFGRDDLFGGLDDDQLEWHGRMRPGTIDGGTGNDRLVANSRRVRDAAMNIEEFRRVRQR